MKPQLFLLLFIVVIIAAATNEIQACSCAPKPPPAEALARADVVFTGKIDKVESMPIKMNPAG